MEISEDLVEDIKDLLNLNDSISVMEKLERFSFSLDSEDIHRIMDLLPAEPKSWEKLAKLADEVEQCQELIDNLDTYGLNSGKKLADRLEWAELGVIK